MVCSVDDDVMIMDWQQASCDTLDEGSHVVVHICTARRQLFGLSQTRLLACCTFPVVPSPSPQASYTFGMGGGYWLLMAELFPLATRTLATSMLTGVVFLMSAVTSLFALSWVCSMRSGLLLIYAGGNVALLVGRPVMLELHQLRHVVHVITSTAHLPSHMYL